MNNTSTRTEILEALENVDSVTMESSLDVMFTMADSYDKAAVILENYNGSDLSSFAIFQEADGEEGSAVQSGKPEGENTAEAKKDDSVLKKILMFIPNMFKKLWQFIKDSWNGVIVPKASDISDEAKAKLKQVCEKLNGEEAKKAENAEAVKKLLIVGGATASFAAIGAGIFAFIKGKQIKERFTGIIDAFRAALKNLKSAKEFVFELREGGFITNLKFGSLKGFFGEIVSRVKAITQKFNELQKDDKMAATIKGEEFDIPVNVVNDIIADKPVEVTWDGMPAILEQVFEGVSVLTSAALPNFDLKDVAMSDSVKAALETLKTKSTPIAKLTAASSKFFEFLTKTGSTIWEKVKGGVAKIFNSETNKVEEYTLVKAQPDDFDSSKYFKKDKEGGFVQGTSGEAWAANTWYTKNEEEPAAQEPAQNPTQNPVQNPEETATEPELNGQYDPAQVEGWVTNINDKNGDRKTVIPYNSHRFQWNKAANKYVYVESAEEDIDVDDSVVSEAATWYNRF